MSIQFIYPCSCGNHSLVLKDQLVGQMSAKQLQLNWIQSSMISPKWEIGSKQRNTQKKKRGTRECFKKEFSHYVITNDWYFWNLRLGDTCRTWVVGKSSFVKGFLYCLNNLGFHECNQHVWMWIVLAMVLHKSTQLFSLLVFLPSFHPFFLSSISLYPYLPTHLKKPL